MAKKIGQIRLRYVQEVDAFQLQVYDEQDKAWYMQSQYKCYRCDKDKPDAVPMFISCKLIAEINDALSIGFELVK